MHITRSSEHRQRRCSALRSNRYEEEMGIVIERDTMRLGKRKAAKEGRPLSDLIEDAVLHYLRKQRSTAAERRTAFHVFCERPMKIPATQLRYVLEEDASDQ